MQNVEISKFKVSISELSPFVPTSPGTLRCSPEPLTAFGRLVSLTLLLTTIYCQRFEFSKATQNNERLGLQVNRTSEKVVLLRFYALFAGGGELQLERDQVF